MNIAARVSTIVAKIPRRRDIDLPGRLDHSSMMGKTIRWNSYGGTSTMAAHECETYDFPVKRDTFEHKALVPYAKGDLAGIERAVRDAKKAATKAGEAAMRHETCASPCKRFIFVDVTVTDITFPFRGAGNIDVKVTGEWQAGILCVHPPG